MKGQTCIPHNNRIVAILYISINLDIIQRGRTHDYLNSFRSTWQIPHYLIVKALSTLGRDGNFRSGSKKAAEQKP